MRTDKERRRVQDGGISRDSCICQGRVGTGGATDARIRTASVSEG